MGNYNILFFEHYEPDTVNLYYSAIPDDTSSIVTNDNGVVRLIDGNIEDDPLFVDNDHGDYNLQNISPCVDRGNPDTSGNQQNNQHKGFF